MTNAQITQIGNNNIAGDPASHTPGILQSNVFSLDGHPATIDQLRRRQPRRHHPDQRSSRIPGQITQNGNLNIASLVEDHYFNSESSIEQTGNSNVANLVHHDTGGAGGWMFQNGDRNLVNIHNDGLNDSSTLTRQTGSDNRIDVLHTSSDHSGVHIEQTGSANIATTIQTGGSFMRGLDPANRGRQLSPPSSRPQHRRPTATSPRPATPTWHRWRRRWLQRRRHHPDRQPEHRGDRAVRHGAFGPKNTAYITQAGNGFGAGIAQSGSDNHAGIYQH